MADGNSFWYAEGAPENTVIWKVDPVANTKEELFDTGRLRNALEGELGHHPPYEGVPFSSFRFVDKEEIAIRFSVEDQEFELDLDTYKINRLPPENEVDKRRRTPQVIRAAHGDFRDLYEVQSPDGKWFVGRKDHNLYLRSPHEDGITWLTTDGIENYAWGDQRASFRTVWSPDSLKLAVVRADYRNVPRIPIVRYLKHTEEVDWVRYPYKADAPMAHQTLYLIDILSKRQVQVETPVGEPYEQFSSVGWLPDGSEYLFTALDRYGKNIRLVAANPKTGSRREIISELLEAQVFWFTTSTETFMNDGKQFVWRSNRDGWHHLYLYNIDGTLVRQLTEGAFLVDRVVTVDERNGWVYLIARPDRQRPYDTHLCRVKLDGSGFEQLTRIAGQHDVRIYWRPLYQIQFSPSKQFFLDSHSSLSRPPQVDLRRADGSLLQTISKADIRALEQLDFRPPEEFVTKGANGKTDLYGTLYKPYDFDPQKKYPVIQMLQYDGVGSQRTFINRRHTHLQALAQLGFIVFTVDIPMAWPRGIRGPEFMRPLYGNFGRHEIPNNVAVLNHLGETRPYMDLDRVGVLGGSITGYFAVRSLLMAPDTYHVGIATYPVLDLYAHLNHTWLGPLEDNREEYEFSSNYRLAGNLKGKLLLIHGTSDYFVPISQTMRMVDALVRADKPFDLLILPEFGHGTNARIYRYWRDRAVEYFVEHLKP
jgi:dipeptidyl aminopeptidase/acylaminoacyl peptidase